jgi:prepilin-type N-terminal cleavage/methylation domain-containing protein
MKGFTLMEMVLASVIGGILLLACLGLFGAMDRADRALAVRHRQAEDMATLHLAMERAFSNLLMATDVQAAAQLQNRAVNERGEQQSPPRPRLLLEDDQGGLGGGSVQRLEVVVSRAPVPPGFRREFAAEVEELVLGGPVRGVFELRPEGEAMAMWWRPLPRAEDEPDGHLFHTDPRDDPRASMLASGITEAQWLVFRNRQREPHISALTVHELPAHMELHVRMNGGYAAQWMFEVAWSNGPETIEEIAAEAEQVLAGEQMGGRRGPGSPQQPGQPGQPGQPDASPRGPDRPVAVPTTRPAPRGNNDSVIR